MNYIYLDKANILHCVNDAKTAAEYSKNGKFVPYNGLVKNGYPMNPLNKTKEITLEEVEKHLPYLDLCNALAKIK